MKGLELSRIFWEEVGKPAFLKDCPEVLEHAVVGLVGEGSECYGFDDEISHDHDFGPGFCMWLEDEEMAAYGQKAADIYNSLPKEFMGFERLRQMEVTASRVGVMSVKSFYQRYTGQQTPPKTIRDWRMIPKNAFAILTNGEIFLENPGEFMTYRKALLDYFPEDLRLKKLAKECALAAQQGQYNYLRCLRHDEKTAAFIALGEFIGNVHQIVFLLEKRYAPYYKWTQKMLRTISPLGENIAGLIDKLVDASAWEKVNIIEDISKLIIEELQWRGLSYSSSTFLLDHAPEIQMKIKDESLIRLPLMSE